MNAEDLIGQWRSMKGERGQFDDHYQEIAERMKPRSADFTAQLNVGARRTHEILDATPLVARRDLASAMYSMLLPTSYHWFNLQAVDDELDDVAEVGLWLDDVESRMWQAIYDPAARFIENSGETIDDLVTFGTGVLYIGLNPTQDGLLFRSHGLKDCWIAENAWGAVDTIFIRRKLKARQAAQLYGPDTSRKVQDALRDNKPNTECEYVHAVMPRKDRAVSKRDNKNMAFAHYTIDVEEKKIVDESGYHEFPYAVPRWETASDEIYGRSPAMLALPDVNTLNEMNYSTLQAAHMVTDPPIAMPTETAIGEQSFMPGGFVYYDPSKLSGGARNAIYPVITPSNLPITLEMQNQRREMIWETFYRNILRIRIPGDNTEKTATEVLQLREEFARLIGPVFARQEHDMPAVITNRVFGIMLRANVFDEPPEALRGRRVDFEFKSAVQQAEKRIEVAATQATFQQALPLIEAKPHVLDNFDEDAILRDMAEGNGMPHDHLRSQEQVQQMRQAAAQAAQAQAAMQEAGGMAEMAGRAAPMVKALQG